MLREWIFFEIFLFGQAVLAYFKGNETGSAIINSFHAACARDLTDSNMLTPEENFEDLLRHRYTYYLDALKEAQEAHDDDLMVLSIRIMDQISGRDSNPLHLPSMAQYYVEVSDLYESLFYELMKRVRVVR